MPERVFRRHAGTLFHSVSKEPVRSESETADTRNGPRKQLRRQRRPQARGRPPHEEQKRRPPAPYERNRSEKLFADKSGNIPARRGTYSPTCSAVPPDSRQSSVTAPDHRPRRSPPHTPPRTGPKQPGGGGSTAPPRADAPNLSPGQASAPTKKEGSGFPNPSRYRSGADYLL